MSGPDYGGLDDPVECENGDVNEESKSKTTNLTPDQQLDFLLNTKKELEEDLGIKPDSKKIPNINQLAENIKTLPPEKKTQLIEFAKQHGTPEHLLKRLGLV